jgi:putative ABC transport system permease protein
MRFQDWGSLVLSWVDGVRLDIAYAFRHVRRQPGFGVVAVLTLALGIGASVAIVSVIDTLLLRAPSFQHLDRLVSLVERHPPEVPFEMNPSPGKFLDWRRQVRAFDRVVAWRNWYFTLAEEHPTGVAPEAVRGVRVSPEFFSMLSVRPAIGRVFRPEEEIPGQDHVVVLSDGLWRRRFGANRQILGQAMLVDGQPFSVVGVLPANFQFFLSDFDLWMPLAIDDAFNERRSHSVMVIARLAPGVSLAQGQANIDGIVRRLGEAYPETDAGWQMTVRPLFPTEEVRAVQPALGVLLGAAGLVLLIACANLAHVLLARATGRRQEIAVRAALGASRGRLVRQLMTESVCLSLVGGVAGLAVALAGVRWLVPLLPHAGTNQTLAAFRAVTPTFDGRLLAVSVVLALLAGVICGVTPAVQTTRALFLRSRGSASGQARAGGLLIAFEVALTIVLLTGAGLLVQSFWRLQAIDPGFRSDHLLTLQLWLPKATYATSSQIRGFYDDVLHRVEHVPGVVGASGISFRPFLSMGMGAPFEVEGEEPRAGPIQRATEYRVVTRGFIRLLGQPLVRGRDFTDADTFETEGVAIINESFARRVWPGQNAVGRRLRPAFHRSVVPWELDAESRWLTVVGVVRDIRGLMPADRDQSQLYVSARQFPSSYMFLVLRTAIPPGAVASAVETEIHKVDPDQPVSNIQTMDEAIAASVPRFNVELLGVFAAMAVLLSVVGIYGVTSYAVSQRTHEIGVRMALGAQSAEVLGMIVRETLGRGAVGFAVGVAAAGVFARLLSGLLYGVTATSPAAYLTAALVLLAVTLLAAYIPARRAAALDPALTLRD